MPVTEQAARIVEWMRYLAGVGQVIEVRAIRPFASSTFGTAAAGEFERLAGLAARQSGVSQGVYFTPNPLRSMRGSGAHGTALDGDIECRNWLLIDVDSKREKDTNATDDERAAAWSVCQSVRDTLQARGFAGIVTGDSGNGYHLMVPVRLPNDDESHGMHRRLLKALGERFGTDAAIVDEKTHNAARIWKLPGTLAMKGEASAERPHRLAALLDTPTDCRQHADANTAHLRKLLADWYVSSKRPAEGAYGRKALWHECNRMAATPAGELNDQLFKSAATLGELIGGGELDENEVRYSLLQAGRAAGCNNPTKDLDTINRGIAKGKQNPRRAPVDETPPTWDTPVNIEPTAGLMKFPVEVFPVVLRRYIAEQSAALNVPPDYFGLMMLGVAGGAIGNTKRLRIKDGYTQSGAIYGVFVARPGTKKSAVVRKVTGPLQDAQKRYFAEFRKQREEWQAAGKSGPAPTRKLCIINGGTVEAVARRLAGNPRGMILATDELSGLIAGMNQYKAGGKGSDRQFYLSAWDQSAYSHERVDEENSFSLTRPFLSVLGAIQPDVLSTLRGAPDVLGNPAPDDGFFDRFLVAYPPEPKDEGETWTEASNASCAAWAAAVEGLLRIDLQPGGTPQYVPLAATARHAYQAVTIEHAAETNAEDFPDYLRGPWSKLLGYFARFILILHQLDSACDGLVEYEADEVHVERAAKLLRYFKSHARRGQATSFDGRIERQARAILDWVKKHTPRFKLSDTWRALRRNKCLFKWRKDLDPPVQFLCDLSVLRKCKADNGDTSRGRPASDTYELNPEASQMA